MSEPKTMSAKPKTPREFYPKSGSYFLHSQKQDIFAFAAAYHAHELAAIRKEIEALKAEQGKDIEALLKTDLGSALPVSVARTLGYEVGSKQAALDHVLRILDAHKP